MMLDLIEPLYANCVINGVDDPNLPQWKAHLEESDEAFRARLAEESGESGWNGSIGPGTVVNTNKVGRNDPCPCGSGKSTRSVAGRSGRELHKTEKSDT